MNYTINLLPVCYAGNLRITDGPKLLSNALVCVSTGGPVTSVTWMRNGQPLSGETKTVLKNPVPAKYIHTLTVTRGQIGMYQCRVSNNEQFIVSTTITVQGYIITFFTSCILQILIV